MWTDDYAIDPAFSAEPAELRSVRSFGVRAIVAAPLVVDAEAVGVLAVYSDRPAAFTERDVALLTMVADHAAGTIANVRLIDQLAGSRASCRAGSRTSGRCARSPPDSRRSPTRPCSSSTSSTRRTGWSTVTGRSSTSSSPGPGPGRAYDSGIKARFGPDDIVDYTLPIGVRSDRPGGRGAARARGRRRPRQRVPAVPRLGPVLRTDGLPLDDRCADRRRRPAARRARGLLDLAARLRRRRRGPRRGPGRPRRGRVDHGPPDDRPHGIALGRSPAGRHQRACARSRPA